MINSFQGQYRFLSNFWPVEVEFEGELYNSTEIACQAAKTNDLALRKLFLNKTPGQAKRLGKMFVLRPDWE